jgi:hypothetical protein
MAILDRRQTLVPLIGVVVQPKNGVSTIANLPTAFRKIP